LLRVLHRVQALQQEQGELQALQLPPWHAPITAASATVERLLCVIAILVGDHAWQGLIIKHWLAVHCETALPHLQSHVLCAEVVHEANVPSLLAHLRN
jgi:hypothetical protein